MPIRRTRRRSARYRADVEIGLRSRAGELAGAGLQRLSTQGRARTAVILVAALIGFTLPSLIIGLPELQRTSSPQLQLLAGLAYSVAVLLIIWPGRRRLDELPAIAAVLAMVSAIELTCDVASPHHLLLSEHWPFHGLHLFVAALALRQRAAWAWGTVGITTALAATHGARSDVGPLIGITPMANVAGVLVITTIVIGEVERLIDRRREARALGASARTDDDAEQDTVNASIRRVHEVRRIAGPHLERIAYDHTPVDQAAVARFRLVEAQLRDSIRGRSISTPALLEATRRARERGVSVDILDERGTVLPAHILGIVGRQSAAILDAAQGGEVTIRAFPDDDPIAVLIVHDPGHDDEDAIALEIAQGTGEISEF